MLRILFIFLFVNHCFSVIQIGITKLTPLSSLKLVDNKDTGIEDKGVSKIFSKLKKDTTDLMVIKLNNLSSSLNEEFKDQQDFTLFDANDLLLASKKTSHSYEFNPNQDKDKDLETNSANENSMLQNTRLIKNGKYILIGSVSSIDTTTKTQVFNATNKSLFISTDVVVSYRLIDTTNDKSYFNFIVNGHAGVSRILPLNINYMPNYKFLSENLVQSAINSLLMNVRHNLEIRL